MTPMPPKEKAQELVESFAETIKPITYGVLIERDWQSAKQCALIAVSMVIQEVHNISQQRIAIYDEKLKYFRYEECKELKYWQEVKTELEIYDPLHPNLYTPWP